MTGKSLKAVVSEYERVRSSLINNAGTYLVTNAASRIASHTLLKGTSLVKVCPADDQIQFAKCHKPCLPCKTLGSVLRACEEEFPVEDVVVVSAKSDVSGSARS